MEEEYASLPETASNRGGRRSRDKGNRVEREIVDRHKSLGIHAERYPLSGASRFRGSAHDVDVYPFGRGEAPITCEVKSRKNGAGFATLDKWLCDFDALFLRRNNADPLVVLPWRVWSQILDRVRP
jgi:Holliday junction resolvase